MKRIRIDFAKSGINEQDFFAYADRVKNIHDKMEKFEGEGSAFLG